jgi:hypothetical protein
MAPTISFQARFKIKAGSFVITRNISSGCRTRVLRSAGGNTPGPLIVSCPYLAGMCVASPESP